MKISIYTFLFIAIGMIELSCDLRDSKSQRIICLNEIDTIEIKTNWSRGAFNLDSLFLDAGLPPIDSLMCEKIKKTIGVTYPSSNFHNCRIGDVPPPFEIFKRLDSDTLVVLKDGKVFYFRIEKHFCEPETRFD